MRILVSGYYGFGNLGDEALLAGLSQHLHSAGHAVTVLSHRPADTRREHGVSARHRIWEAVPALLTCDALVSGGGGLLQDTTSSRSLDYYLGLIRLGKTLGKRVVVFGQSVGPLTERGWERTARSLAGVPVSVRDPHSHARAATHGIKAHLGADAALLLTCPAKPRPGGPVLFIPRHGNRSSTEALATVANRLSRSRVDVVCLALHAAQDSAEVEVLRRLAPTLELWRAASYRDALERVAASAYVVSARLHGLILASMCGRGHAGVIYDPKVAGFLEESGGIGFAPPVDPALLLETVMNGAASSPRAGAALKARAEAGFTWLLARLSA